MSNSATKFCPCKVCLCDTKVPIARVELQNRLVNDGVSDQHNLLTQELELNDNSWSMPVGKVKEFTNVSDLVEFLKGSSWKAADVWAKNSEN